MQITEDQITAAARALSNDNADICNVNREDNWMLYGDSFRETAKIALEAAFAEFDNPENTGVGTYCQPGDQSEPRWLLKFDDAERGACVYETEQEAREAFAHSEGRGWNCWLFSPTPRALASNKAAAVAVTDLAADISADRHFIAGVKLGWNFRDANDEKGFQACIEGRSAQIREAKATPPAPIASASEAVPDAWMHILAKPGKRTVWASVEENDTPEDLRDWLKKPNSYRVDKPLYTHPAAAQPSRAEVLEDAASLIEPKNGPNDWTEYAKIKAECAAAIRALKDKP
jgi:hypothetical protein